MDAVGTGDPDLAMVDAILQPWQQNEVSRVFQIETFNVLSSVD